MAGISYGRCTLFGILVDAHVWHIGRCTWLAYGGNISWMISFGTLLMYMVDVHGFCAWWAHFGT